MSNQRQAISKRFRGFLPVVVDVECGGFNPATDALLEISAIVIACDESGWLTPADERHFNVQPFSGANMSTASLEFTGIDPDSPLRGAVPESEAISGIFTTVRAAMREAGCQRAVLVGHNAHFDHSFVFAAADRCNAKRNPFHPFSCLDTVSLSALTYGQTVLQKACGLAGVTYDEDQAHSARYDCRCTAELFCRIVNYYQSLGGWPPTAAAP